jgi:hypothetical protein
MCPSASVKLEKMQWLCGNGAGALGVIFEAVRIAVWKLLGSVGGTSILRKEIRLKYKKKESTWNADRRPAESQRRF